MPIRPRHGKWHYRFQVDGHEYTGNTDLDATERNRNAAMKVEWKAQESVSSGRAHELKLQIKVFNEAVQEFLVWADGEHASHPNTAKRLRTSFASLAEFFRTMPVSRILPGHVNDYKSWRRREHKVRDVTIRHDLHALSKAFQYFIDHNWARENPVRGVDIPSDKDAVRIHVLENDEEFLYFNAAREMFPALHDVGRLMLNQGCRPDEILNLQAAHVDLEKGVLTIAEGKSRASKRSLHLMHESRGILSRRISVGNRWLFSGKVPGARMAKLNGQHAKLLAALATCRCGHRKLQHGDQGCTCECRRFEEVSRLAFVPYDFRHTFATRAGEMGMPPAVLAKILGHADLRTIMKYVHVREDAKTQAMRAFEAYLESQNERADDPSAFRPVGIAEMRESAVSTGITKEELNARKVN